MGRRRGAGVLVAAIMVNSWGCSGSRAVPGPASGAGTTATSATAAASTTTSSDSSAAGEVAISQFGRGNGVDADFAAVEDAVRADPDGLRTAALRHLDDRDAMVHHAAVYALARTAGTDESIRALQGLLTSARVDDRLLAAGALVYRGDSSGIPVLIDELDSPEAMALRDPPDTASGFAARLLLRFTTEDFGLRAATDAASIAQVKPSWQRWWDDHGTALLWDPATGEFH